MTKNEKPSRINLAVGDTVWMFSSGDRPTEFKVTGDTSRSWLVSRGGWVVKVPKSFAGSVYEVQPNFGGTQFYCLSSDAADAMLLKRARWTMALRVKECTDAATLRKVAEALGMTTTVISNGEATP